MEFVEHSTDRLQALAGTKLSCGNDRLDIGALFGGSRIFNWLSNSLTRRSVETFPIVEHLAKLPTDILGYC